MTRVRRKALTSACVLGPKGEWKGTPAPVCLPALANLGQTSQLAKQDYAIAWRISSGMLNTGGVSRRTGVG
jgi:hypothetical protein